MNVMECVAYKFNNTIIMTNNGTKESQKPKMTAKNMMEKWSYMKYDHDQLMFSDKHKDEFLADLRSVIRGELIRFIDWLELIPSEGVDETNEMIADDFLNNNQ